MQYSLFFRGIKARFGWIVLTSILIAAASFLFLIMTQSAFKVRTDFLITQSNSGSQDFYSLSRSAEYAGKVLSEAVYSERFVEAVVETGKVRSDFLPADKKERLDQWSEMIKIQKNLELGMIQVSVLHDNQRDALQISQAVADVLTQKNSQFRGGDENSVSVRILSGPIIEKNPSIIEIILVFIGGFLFGMLLSIFWIFIKTEVLHVSEDRSDIMLN